MNVQHTTVVKSYTTVVSVKRRDLVAVTNGATVEDRRITGGDDVTTQTFKALERGGGGIEVNDTRPSTIRSLYSRDVRSRNFRRMN